MKTKVYQRTTKHIRIDSLLYEELMRIAKARKTTLRELTEGCLIDLLEVKTQ